MVLEEVDAALCVAARSELGDALLRTLSMLVVVKKEDAQQQSILLFAIECIRKYKTVVTVCGASRGNIARPTRLQWCFPSTISFTSLFAYRLTQSSASGMSRLEASCVQYLATGR